MKPMLAVDYDQKKLQFPLIVQPKIDGVRAININGKLKGRSLKAHRNKYVTELLSHPLYNGLDGEIVVGDCTSESICRDTSSALSSIEGTPDFTWYIFDYLGEDKYRTQLGYIDRLQRVKEIVKEIHDYGVDFYFVQVIPSRICVSHVELEAFHDEWVAQGYEGVIIRSMYGRFKEGRSSNVTGGLLRVKKFVEEEAVVISITEGSNNANEKEVNELGRSFRSTKKSGMTPSGKVGTLKCVDVKTGRDIDVSPGKLTAKERELYWVKPELLIGETIKYRCFPIGVKDKPRFPTFQTIRISSDIQV